MRHFPDCLWFQRAGAASTVPRGTYARRDAATTAKISTSAEPEALTITSGDPSVER